MLDRQNPSFLAGVLFLSYIKIMNKQTKPDTEHKDAKPLAPKKLKHKDDVKGQTAPTKPPEKINKQDSKIIATVVPSDGFALVRLVNPKAREKIGFSKDSTAFQAAALVEVIRYHQSNDKMAEDFPVGTYVFASLEELAPLLNTLYFLMPFTRFMGHVPTGVLAPTKNRMGFK